METQDNSKVCFRLTYMLQVKFDLKVDYDFPLFDIHYHILA